MNVSSPAPATSWPHRPLRSERFLATLASFPRVVLVSHINPDPDALASMLGLEALIRARQSEKPVVKTFEGMIARAENQAMVHLVPIDVEPIETVPVTAETAVVMVDSQPNTGRRCDESPCPLIVLDHHETPGVLNGVKYCDIRPDVGATSTIVTGYLIEQGVGITPRLAAALYYGIDSEIAGYPREAGPLDDGALVWLFPRCDKDLLARIRNPRLPQSYFATYQHALTNAFLYQNVVVAWCGVVPQPDIIAELADFFVRFDQVSWALTVGRFENMLKMSVRSDHMNGHCGELLREVVHGLGTAGGHDKRAGGAVPMVETSPAAIEGLLTTIRQRFLSRLQIDEHQGRRLLESAPAIAAP